MSFLLRVLHQEKPPRLRSLSSSNVSRSPRFTLNIALESPPVVLYGLPHESTGSIISGVLSVEVGRAKSPQPDIRASLEASLTPTSSNRSYGPHGSPAPPVSIDLDLVVLRLVQTVHYTKPFMLPQVLTCKDCATRRTELARWDVLLATALFPMGSHAYPFSYLLPGLVLATTKLGSSASQTYVKYELIAEAKKGESSTRLVLPIQVLRSVLRGPDRNSLRVFPPTDVTASAVLPNVIYPKSTFPIELRLENVVNSKQDRRWRMRKLTWKIEEHTQARVSTCEAHASKLTAAEESQRKTKLYKSLKQGGEQGPSKTLGLHHLTVQTSLVLSAPPTLRSGLVPVNSTEEPGSSLNRDVVPEPEPEVTNRPDEEAVNFDHDFGHQLGATGVPADNDIENENGNENENVNATEITLDPPSSASSRSPRDVSNQPSRLAPSETVPTGSKESLYVDELRVVAHGEVKSGWKSDFTGKGRIEVVAEISAIDCSTGVTPHISRASLADARFDDSTRPDANISCDIEDPQLGVYISHVLVVEVIVAEEVVQGMKKGASADAHAEGQNPLSPVTSSNSIGSHTSSAQVGVPTGAARVLRMQFRTTVTERLGLGIAWDDEVPPTYNDVRGLSPPTYETLSSLMQMSPAVRTPAVIQGFGDTPMDAFLQGDDLDERILELQI